MVRHIVLVRFGTDTEPAEIDAILRQLGDLRAMVPGFLAFAAGPNVSPEGLGRGFTHAFTCDFADAAARDAYLVHPAHQVAGARLVAAAQGGIGGLAVIDVDVG